MKAFQLLPLLLFLGGAVQAQESSYKFRIPAQDDYYEVRLDSGPMVTATYRRSAQDESPSRFVKVYLDRFLSPMDSVEFDIPGLVDLYQSYSNARYAVHVFKTRQQSPEFFHLVILSNRGRIVSRLVLKFADIQPYFSKELNDWNNVSFTFYDHSDPEVLVFRPIATRTYAPLHGQVIAIDIHTGGIRWSSNVPAFLRTTFVDDAIVGLHTDVMRSNLKSQIYFISEKTGKVFRRDSLYVGKGYRFVWTFKPVGNYVLISGRQKDQPFQEHGQIYVTLYDRYGNRIVNIQDTVKHIFRRMTRMAASGHRLTAEIVPDGDAFGFKGLGVDADLDSATVSAMATAIAQERTRDRVYTFSEFERLAAKTTDNRGWTAVRPNLDLAEELEEMFTTYTYSELMPRGPNVTSFGYILHFASGTRVSLTYKDKD